MRISTVRSQNRLLDDFASVNDVPIELEATLGYVASVAGL